MGRDRSRLIGSATGTARAAIVVIPGAFLLAFFVYPVTTILARGLATDGFDPFTDLFGFIEASQTHFELVGEMWWVLVRNGRGVPGNRVQARQRLIQE